MSAEVLPRIATAESSDELRPVYFKVTLRVDTSLMPWWERVIYEFNVRVLGVPGKIPMEIGGLSTFAVADSYCVHKDDQIHVMPWGWVYPRDEINPDIVCRPRDSADWKRYKALREKYADYDADEYLMITRSDYRRLMEAQEMITESKRRMKNALRD